MALSRISSLLRRNPFKPKFISSSSPLNNLNLTAISEFRPQIFPNPRNFSAEAAGFDLKREKDELNRKYDEAEDAISLVQESRDCVVLWPYYQEKAELADAAINNVIEKYNGLISKLGDKEKEDFEKSEGKWIIRIKETREKLMNHELMNFEEMLQKRYGGISKQKVH